MRHSSFPHHLFSSFSPSHIHWFNIIGHSCQGTQAAASEKVIDIETEQKEEIPKGWCSLFTRNRQGSALCPPPQAKSKLGSLSFISHRIFIRHLTSTDVIKIKNSSSSHLPRCIIQCLLPEYDPGQARELVCQIERKRNLSRWLPLSLNPWQENMNEESKAMSFSLWVWRPSVPSIHPDTTSSGLQLIRFSDSFNGPLSSGMSVTVRCGETEKRKTSCVVEATGQSGRERESEREKRTLVRQNVMIYRWQTFRCIEQMASIIFLCHKNGVTWLDDHLFIRKCSRLKNNATSLPDHIATMILFSSPAISSQVTRSSVCCSGSRLLNSCPTDEINRSPIIQ